MAQITEPLSGGLVTNLDPALLQPGQLSYIQNRVYRADSQSLFRAAGREIFGVVSATATAVEGLRDVKFDNGDHYLIGHASSVYLSATVGDTGTFGTLASGMGAGSQLEAIHFRNRFYLLNGVSTEATAAASNRVVYLSATAAGSVGQNRVHGLLPVIDTPATASAGGGQFSQTVTGYYEYWTTEVAKLTQDGAEFVMESAFSGTPVTVFITTTAIVPTIFMPTIRNPLTTHWRIYRSPKKEKETDKKFPTGFMISETATATASQADTTTVSTTSYAFPTLFNSGVRYSDATNASNLGADDGNVATLTPAGIQFVQSQGTYGYNFGGFAGNVRGIEVEMQAFASVANCPVTVKIGPKRLVNGEWAFYTLGGGGGGITIGQGVEPVAKSAVVTATSAPGQILTFGSSSDRWVPSDKKQFSDADFNTDWMLVVSMSKPATTLSIDYVKARVHYAGTTDSVIQFPTVVYTFGDITVQEAKNGPPPSSSTGDIYEDSLVLNDIANPSFVRWSYPGDPEAFPGSYFIDLETGRNDIVTNIKVVNESLMVFCLDAFARFNYLPSERDASFDRGKAYKWVSSTFGCVNAMCACVYSPDGDSERLAFVSLKGIHDTNGYELNDIADVDWRTIIPLGTTATPICLINNPEELELLLFYRNDSNGNETYLCLHLNYGADHRLPGGKLKVSGPVNMRNFHSGSATFASLESAWTVPRTNGSHSVYMGYGGTNTNPGAGKVYIESGSTIPAQDPAAKYRTRTMYLAEFGHEWRLDKIHGYAPSQTGTQTTSYTTLIEQTNIATASGATESIEIPTGRKMHRMVIRQQGEGIMIENAITSGHDDREDAFLVIEGTGFGEEDSGS